MRSVYKKINVFVVKSGITKYVLFENKQTFTSLSCV